MVASREAYLASCRRAEPSLAGICSVGQGADAGSGFPLGTWSALVAEPFVLAVAPV